MQHSVLKILGTLLFSLSFSSFSSFSQVERPSIWVKPSERLQILNKINTQPWAHELFVELQLRVDSLAVDDIAQRNTNLRVLPLQWSVDKSIPPSLPLFQVKGGGSRAELQQVIKTLQDGVDCGVLYYLTQQTRYAQCGADILHTYINALLQHPLSTEKNMNAGWLFPTNHLYEARVIGAQLPVLYDFVYPYLKNGGQVYDLAQGKLSEFNFENAQTTFKNYVFLALSRGLLDSNWPVLESLSLVHNILAFDDQAEINKHLPYYTHINTKRQASLKMVAEMFEKEGDIWPESFQYSQHVAAYSVYLMTLLDRYDQGLKLGSKYPNISAAFMSYYNLQFPNEDYPFIGDGHRQYPIEYSALEMSYLLAKMNNNQQQMRDYGNYLNSSISKGIYDRGHLHDRYYKAAPYFTPTQLLWYEDKISSTETVDVAPPRPRTKRLEYAGLNIQRNIAKQNPEKNSLMGFIGGGSYIHGHASGIDMELYGQGHVLGVTSGKSKYRTDIHENFYRIFAAHNTVISNGASASKGGWINLGINRVQAVAVEPEYGQAGVSGSYSFTTSSFYDEFNLVAPAYHQRTLALIKLNEKQGYYLDVFKAKSDYAEQYHDYLYRNLADNISVTSGGELLKTTATPERYQASAQLPWTLQRAYRHPGWHFLTEVKTANELSKGYAVTFTANKLAKKDIYMRALVPDGLETEFTTANAPPAYGVPNAYKDKPTPMFLMRHKGETWSNPFAVVYESKTQGEQFAVKSVERIMQNGQFKGVKVEVMLANKPVTQYILLQDLDAKPYKDETLGIYFDGHFAVISLDAANQPIDMYIGQGRELHFKNSKLTAQPALASGYIKF
ncbi:heparinase II/III domain-containing protein [Catenovulum agarivorans]|uniref:heparinase II/III domain-containing protein n=1 Tax=Catenovulum agarivorans TaxID=1172192 RepID=UPI0012FAC8D3|nr:heparinase II/III family protein [Catenovulum agarivorans]